MNLMDAVKGISDRHIVEFAYVKREKKHITRRRILISAAACLAVITAVIAAVPFVRNNTKSVNGLLPHVYINDRAYTFYGRSDNGISVLPAGYVLIGEITSADRNNKRVNGYGEMLRIGEKIYQNPDFPEDVYVYTTLFTGGERYRNVLFTDGTYERVYINGKTYVRDFDHEDRYLKNKPAGYGLIGEVTTNDRSNRYVDGYGQSLNIGDKIYRSPADPDVVYVYTNVFLADDYYVRFAAYDK